MAKLADKTAWDLMATLTEMAEPVGNLVNDDNFWDVFAQCTQKGVGLKQKNTLRWFLSTYAELFPVLMGEEHRLDTFRILAYCAGKSVEEVARMNGMELLDLVKGVYRDTLLPFFTSSGLSALSE